MRETFAGDINGESPVRALEVRHNRSASLVSLRRFRGKLDGREGTFVLQGQEIVENSNVTAKWFVVPGSGTGGLAGLRGEGGFEGHFGKGTDATLDYCSNDPYSAIHVRARLIAGEDFCVCCALPFDHEL